MSLAKRTSATAEPESRHCYYDSCTSIYAVVVIGLARNLCRGVSFSCISLLRLLENKI